MTIYMSVHEGSLDHHNSWPSPLLIYIDGITSIPISSGTQTVLYADGLLLCYQISRQEDFTTLQRDIMANEQWVLDNHLTAKGLIYISTYSK